MGFDVIVNRLRVSRRDGVEAVHNVNSTNLIKTVDEPH